MDLLWKSAKERRLAMKKILDSRKAAEATVSDPRWESVLAKDKNSDGRFFFSVKTTGVYCRPSCGARTPRPENVRFYKTTEEAEAAGFRPCKRCRPAGLSLTARNSAKIAKACRLIERAGQSVALESLAKSVAMSPYHFHRTFKAVTGLTPADYAKAHRSKRMRKTLTGGNSVTEAIYDAGYGSSSRFYEAADDVLGMTASSFKKGGAGAEIHFAIGDCSLGAILVARSERGVCAVLIGDDPDRLVRDLQDQFPQAELKGDEKEFEETVAKVVGLVERPSAGLDLPLDIRGTAFQRQVWKALQQIPVGSTATYAEIAEKINMPKAVRAVAQACASNALAVAIPCHRVIRSDGGLSGYRWGVERKRALLDREAARFVG
jgi:AraC family transcriptional regulator, regulatory protein of adaptative response / methylated-DNA-[protein]-cysteine methyltransferase